jgi:hypothetical protein
MPKTLFPDPDSMNAEPAQWAAAALHEFQRITGTDDEDSLADLLCDLMHWCNQEDVDFGTALSRVQMNYEAETAPELIEEADC